MRETEVASLEEELTFLSITNPKPSVYGYNVF